MTALKACVMALFAWRWWFSGSSFNIRLLVGASSGAFGKRILKIVEGILKNVAEIFEVFKNCREIF
jgi:hypothetical protein